jgi:nucleotide-binding universal stress UspA family protein
MTQAIERVVVPLDAASEIRTAIDTAARLAARWQVPLHGVFVEDEELVCLAGLPFACQVTLATGREPLTKDHVEDHFRAFAERARRELGAAAARHGVDWSFEVVPGPRVANALGGAEHDFVVAGAATRPIGSHFRVASRWWSSIEIIARPFLLAQREWGTGGSVLTVLRGRGPESARALDIAAQIAGFCGSMLTIAGPSDPAGSDDFAAWVSGLLKGRSLTLQTELIATGPDALKQRITELDCRLLVLEASKDEAQPDDLRKQFAHLSCDLLVVR